MSLAEMTEGMKKNVAERGGIDGKVVLFDFGDEGAIRIDATGSDVVVDNATGEADCTIGLSMEDFEDIASGELDAQMAFMSGKLKIDGDMGIAMQLSSLLG